MHPKSIKRLMPPARSSELNTLSESCGILPSSYLAFLEESNGVEWVVKNQDGDCLKIWSAQDVPVYNNDYDIALYLPELLAFGSDGGDGAVAFDRAVSDDPECWTIVRIGFGNLDRADFVQLATGFRSWQASEFRLKRG